MYMPQIEITHNSLSDFFQDVLRFSPDYYIVGGDFNLALDPTDRKGSTVNNDCSASWLRHFLSENSFIDAWRYFHPELQEFTWRRL